MGDEAGGNVIRRKLAAARAVVAEGAAGADRSWRIALARAARDELKLPLEVTALSIERRSLAELLELTPERALISVLEGPAEGLGVIILAPDVLSAMIEGLTLGRVSATPALSRKPTRTDAAMVAGMLDAALVGLETALAEETDLVWAGGFRYASFLDDPRPLGLLLEDCEYRMLRAEVSLANGAKTGVVFLALPAKGRGHGPARKNHMDEAGLAAAQFRQEFSERVIGADSVLVAVLARLSMPLSDVMSLVVGQVLAMPRAGLDQISMEGLDGRCLSVGKLGQNRGMRAIRLSLHESADRAELSAGSPQSSQSQTTPATALHRAAPLRAAS